MVLLQLQLDGIVLAWVLLHFTSVVYWNMHPFWFQLFLTLLMCGELQLHALSLYPKDGILTMHLQIHLPPPGSFQPWLYGGTSVAQCCVGVVLFSMVCMILFKCTNQRSFWQQIVLMIVSLAFASGHSRVWAHWKNIMHDLFFCFSPGVYEPGKLCLALRCEPVSLR